MGSRSVGRGGGVGVEGVGVADWCRREAVGVGRKRCGWGSGILEEGSGGRNAESGRYAWVEVEGRCGRIGSDSCSEESILDWVAIRCWDVGSSVGAGLHF